MLENTIRYLNKEGYKIIFNPCPFNDVVVDIQVLKNGNGYSYRVSEY